MIPLSTVISTGELVRMVVNWCLLGTGDETPTVAVPAGTGQALTRGCDDRRPQTTFLEVGVDDDCDRPNEELVKKDRLKNNT